MKKNRQISHARRVLTWLQKELQQPVWQTDFKQPLVCVWSCKSSGLQVWFDMPFPYQPIGQLVVLDALSEVKTPLYKLQSRKHVRDCLRRSNNRLISRLHDPKLHLLPVITFTNTKRDYGAMTPMLPGALGIGDTREEAVIDLEASLSLLITSYADRQRRTPWVYKYDMDEEVAAYPDAVIQRIVFQLSLAEKHE